MSSEIKKVGVLGAGLMGHGIAQVTATAGYDVVLREVDDETLQKGMGKIEKQLAKAVEKGRSSQEDADAVRGRIQGTTDYNDLADCDLVIEAITEDLGRKLEMWKEVDAVVKPEAVFATNTSSLAVIDQAASTTRPAQFVGLHYFNPAQVMKLVEVIRAVTTSDEAFETAHAFAQAQGKLAIPTKDKAGFIVNRLLVPYMLDAMRAYEEGVGSVDEIDEAMKAGAGAPDGPAHAGGLRGPRHARARSATSCSTSSASGASPSRRRCARCSAPAGTGARAAWASTTTRAKRPCRTRVSESSMAGVLAALRPEPHRGDQVAAGAVVLTTAIYVLEARFANTWGAGIRFVIDALALFAVAALAVQSPIEGERPRAYQSVLYIATFFLAAVTLKQPRRHPRRRQSAAGIGNGPVDRTAARRALRVVRGSAQLGGHDAARRRQLRIRGRGVHRLGVRPARPHDVPLDPAAARARVRARVAQRARRPPAARRAARQRGRPVRGGARRVVRARGAHHVQRRPAARAWAPAGSSSCSPVGSGCAPTPPSIASAGPPTSASSCSCCSC